MADLKVDQPYLPIREKNPCFGGREFYDGTGELDRTGVGFSQNKM
jgi:hypothetical protein